MFSLVSAYKN